MTLPNPVTSSDTYEPLVKYGKSFDITTGERTQFVQPTFDAPQGPSDYQRIDNPSFQHRDSADPFDFTGSLI
jgi:hypothetical protein